MIMPSPRPHRNEIWTFYLAKKRIKQREKAKRKQNNDSNNITLKAHINKACKKNPKKQMKTKQTKEK